MDKQADTTNTPDSRTVRVFISSTFQDMKEERDYLVKHTFPELRNRCRQRQVEFVAVDLRWGITEEQAHQGEVLPICLAEIDRCPYFISLLGDRYGWIPDQIDAKLLREHKWLKKHPEKSITELEILYGALNNHKSSKQAFAYLRKRSYIKSLPASKRKGYDEEPSRDETRRLGAKEVLALAKERRKKLSSLKKCIRESNIPFRYYSDLKSLGKRILDDLWRAIDAAYPAISVKDALERENEEQMLFAVSRANAYVPRSEYYARLESHIKTEEPPLIIIGESGYGKTSLIANWALNYQKMRPNEFMILHFVGSTTQSTDYEFIIRRIMGEIKRRYKLRDSIPSSSKELRKSFPSWLKKAAEKGRMILLIDGLNQLDSRDNAHTLDWLPEVLPHNICMIGSTLPGRTLDAVLERNWSTFKVTALELAERHQVIVKYLGQFGKTLEDTLIKRIIVMPQCANPLYIRALLEELRVFGDYDRLSEQIEKYLKAKDALSLYDVILERMENDYERDRKGLVKDAMSLIWVSHRGLYENELLELLADRSEPLPRAIWSPFNLAIQESLVSRSGQLGFFHDYLRQAVKNRYLANPEDEFQAHKQLAEYYECMFSDAGGAENYRMMSLHAAEEALNVAQKSKNDELRVEGYLLLAGSLISAAVGISHENASLFKKAGEMARKGCNVAEKINTKNAKLLLASGLCLRARTESGYNPEYGNMSLINNAIKIYKGYKDWEGHRFSRYGMSTSYCDALYEKAVIGLRFGKWRVVEKSLTEAQRTHEHLKNYDPLKKAHITQVWGEYYALRGWWDKSRDKLMQAMAEYKKCKYPGGVCAARGWLGLSLCNLGESRNGLSLIKESLKFERDDLGSQEGVAKWLHYLGEYFQRNKEKKRALHVFWLCEEMREMQNHAELIKTKKILEEIKMVDEKDYRQLKEDFYPRKSEFGEYAFLWGLGQFNKYPQNPILLPQGDAWESKAVFNPAALTDGKKIYLLYRAEGPDQGSKRGFVSKIGFAESKDGIHFKRDSQPVMVPTEPYEKEGGCEDPRVVFIEGIYYMTYTAYDGTTARLAIAVSKDLREWKKCGTVFTDEQLSELEDSQMPKGWSKSGSIYNERIGGYYWMFFGENNIWAANSRDLIKWEVVKKPILSPRADLFDSYLVEPGPPCMMLSDPGPPPIEGIWLGYNGAAKTKGGRLRYSFGQVLLDPNDPTKVIRRSIRPILEPTTSEEIHGKRC